MSGLQDSVVNATIGLWYLQVARPSANQSSRTSPASPNLGERRTVAGLSLQRRRSSPPPPPARTCSSLRHSTSSLYHATRFGSEPVNVYPPEKEMSYYHNTHEPQCYYYYNSQNQACYYTSAPNSLLNRHFTSETAIHQSHDKNPPCPVHPHRHKERTSTSNNANVKLKDLLTASKIGPQESQIESSNRHSALESRHQELLLTRKRLQERYAQVQQWNSRSVPMGVSGLRHGSTGTKPQSSDSSDANQPPVQPSEPQSSATAPSGGLSDDQPKPEDSVKETVVKAYTDTNPLETDDKLSESSLISNLLNSSALETDIL